MSNTSIYYSKFNLDSSMGALIVSKTLKKLEDDTIDLISYNRTSPIKVNTDQDNIWIIGADISALDITTIIDKNPNAKITIANHFGSEKYNVNIKEKITLDLTKASMDESDGHIPNSMAYVVYRYLELHVPNGKFENVFLNIDKNLFTTFLDAVVKYCNFLLMSQEETLLVYKNIENVYNTLEENEPFWFTIINKQHEKEYAKHVKNLRVIIERNFALRYLTMDTRWLNTPILSVSNENAFAVMKLISYSYDNVVTYEDNSSSRVYRVYSMSNKEWFIKTIKPNDIWIEGNLMFLKTEIPSIQNH